MKKSSFFIHRYCRTLRISAEHNTGVRIADDTPLLSWLPRFAAQVMNKMRIGKDGNTRELRRSGRRWRKPKAQFGEKVCMTQGIFVGHHDRTGSSIVHYQEWSYARQKVGQNRHKVMLGNRRIGKVCVALRDKMWLKN